MKKQAIELFRKIADLQQVCEATRDNTGLTADEEEFYNIIVFCSDLLARIAYNKNQLIDIDLDKYTPLPVTADPLIDFVYQILQKQSGLDMRALLKRFIRNTKSELSDEARIRRATLIDYLSNKSDITTETFIRYLEASFKLDEK